LPVHVSHVGQHPVSGGWLELDELLDEEELDEEDDELELDDDDDELELEDDELELEELLELDELELDEEELEDDEELELLELEELDDDGGGELLELDEEDELELLDKSKGSNDRDAFPETPNVGTRDLPALRAIPASTKS